jgi:enoyl-CoA hydratase/carnithine racemase
VPGAGGTVSLPRRIGARAFARWAIVGDELDAAAALALGLVDEVP